MALEAVVFPQDPLSYGCKDNNDINNCLYSIVGASCNGHAEGGGNYHNAPWAGGVVKDRCDSTEPCVTTRGSRKRRRVKTVRKEEEIEHQRMTHIAVERNRRKQMNEYLSRLRALMPSSYVQKGDQASIIGGAINFVKELEQLLQCIMAQNKANQPSCTNEGSSSPFAEFFMFPQYSTRATHHDPVPYPAGASATQPWPAVADIEVSLVDSHANVKILLERKPGLLVNIVVGLQSLGFTLLLLSVTTSDVMLFTSVIVKVEEKCQLNTADEIAAAVNKLLRIVHEETAFHVYQLNL